MPASSRRVGRATRWAGAVAIGFAAVLLALAVPIAGAALVRLPGDAVLADLRAGQPVGPEDLTRLADSRRAAARWRGDPRDASARALAILLLAERAGERAPDRLHAGERAQNRLHAAEAHLRTALAGAPADPFAWTRLALVRWRLDRPKAEVRAALDAARRTGAHTRRLQPVHRALTARLEKARDD